MLAPAGAGFNTTLSFRNWECTKYCRRIYSGYRNNDKHHPNANWPYAKTERCSPLQVRDFLYNVAVGAAIGRPSVKIRSDVKQNASAK